MRRSDGRQDAAGGRRPPASTGSRARGIPGAATGDAAAGAAGRRGGRDGRFCVSRDGRHAGRRRRARPGIRRRGRVASQADDRVLAGHRTGGDARARRRQERTGRRRGDRIADAREGIPGGLPPPEPGRRAPRRHPLSLPRHGQAGQRPSRTTACRAGRRRRGGGRGRGPAGAIRFQPERARRRGIDRSAGRATRRSPRALRDAGPPAQEQPGPGRRSGGRQDGDRRGACARRPRGERARADLQGHDLRPGHGDPAGGNALPRRLRAAPEGGDRPDHLGTRAHPVHRRDPHDRRRRRRFVGFAGRLEHPEARPRLGQAALHRLDHARPSTRARSTATARWRAASR